MTSIRDIIGYCPMGCGPHLHLMPGGMIKCLRINCPDPGAAHKILSDTETEHVIVYKDGTYVVRHPLRERRNDELVDCVVAGAVFALSRHPEGDGRYRATLDENEHLIMTLIE